MQSARCTVVKQQDLAALTRNSWAGLLKTFINRKREKDKVMKDNVNRTRIVGIRLTKTEFEKIEKNWKDSTCRKMSDYLRRIIFEKPIVATYRNRSMDDFMAEMIRLRTELNSIGNNFNQLVKKLHVTQQTDSIISLLLSYELDKRTLLKHIAAIQLFIEKNEEKW